jgi:uncharacterized protein YxeA
MDTIISYLDNLFASLPKSEKILKAKHDLLSSMEEKYRALKSEGKSENEAVGTVISEFGNIDELIDELGLKRTADGQQLPRLKEEDIREFLAVNRQAGLLIGLGVFLCIISVAMFFLFSLLAKDGLLARYMAPGSGSVLGLIVMLLLIAIGVGLFIYSGLRLEKYAYLEKPFELPTLVRSDLQRKMDQNAPAFTASIVIGVGLCIISPVPLFFSTIFQGFHQVYGLIMLLTIIAIAVFLFTNAGMVRDGYNKLLQLEEYALEKQKESKVTGAVASVLFPLVTAIYLYLGFVRNLWHPGWIIFVAAGILFGIFSTIYSSVQQTKKPN